MDQAKLFEIRRTEGRGFGAFARNQIPAGILLLSERPLLRIDDPEYTKAKLQAVFDSVSPEQQAKFLSLHSAHGQDPSNYPRNGPYPRLPFEEKERISEQHEARIADEKSVMSIMMTNAMTCESGAAVFEVASRFNHSCVANAFFYWDEKKQAECIRATRDISRGEEITLSYIDPYDTLSMRKWELQHYGFHCDCPACEGDTEDPQSFFMQSVERRWRLKEIDETIYASDSERVKAKIEEAALMQEEGLINANLAELYLVIAGLLDSLDNASYAIAAAEKALFYYTICMGADSDGADAAVKAIRAYKKQVMPERKK